jgi:hypothetical protein
MIWNTVLAAISKLLGSSTRKKAIVINISHVDGDALASLFEKTITQLSDNDAYRGMDEKEFRCRKGYAVRIAWYYVYAALQHPTLYPRASQFVREHFAVQVATPQPHTLLHVLQHTASKWPSPHRSTEDYFYELKEEEDPTGQLPFGKRKEKPF